MILMGGLTLILLAMMLHQKTRTQIVAAVTRMGNPSQDSEKPRTRGATSWWLIATSGQYSGSELELKGILQLGRDPRIAQFIFEDPDISKLHITLTLNDECMTLEDQYSTNGTQLNGHDVPPGEEIAVNSGDLIRLAETQEIFKVEKR
jgi:hypothetical protein